jgi:hypothetical protein
MPSSRARSPEHLRSFTSLTQHIAKKKLGFVDSRDWREDWADRWVTYADLIAFASRALRSETVVLNNIVRFDRASTLVAREFPNVAVRRFSDATFAVAQTFHEAMAVGVALSHACLAFNADFLDRGVKPFFIHLVVPRVTIARGRVLMVASTDAHPKLDGITAEHILAGSAIVKAYQLERRSAGGLLTVDTEGLDQIRRLAVRGHNGRVTNGLRRWISRVNDDDAVAKGEVFFHRRSVVDVPWLLLRPFQREDGILWGADNADADVALRSYRDVWDKSIREFHSPQNGDASLEVSKHYLAAMRHAVQCHHASHGRRIPKYQADSELWG